jgi:hypothetical protein
MRILRVLLVTFGVLGVLAGLVLAAGGAVVTWAYATQRDSAGFFSTDVERLDTPTFAVASDPAFLGERGRARDWRHDWGDLLTVRLRIDGAAGQPVFVGVGPEDDVDAWLAGTSHAVLSDVDFDPFDPTYDVQPGRLAPDDPEAQDFWVASASGRGRQTVEWDFDEGDWVAVVMNADSTRGVAFDASVGVKSDRVLPIGIGLLVAGGVSLIVATAMIVVAVARRGAIDALTVGTTVPPDAPYPVRVDAELEAGTSRWLWLVKWLLLVPHYVVLVVLWVCFGAVTVAAGFAILFTGRYPRSLFDFNVGVLRWTWRVQYYGYSALGTDRYPPFTLAQVPGYPARVDVAYPERLSRGLVLVKWWLLAIPHYVVVAVFTGGGLLGWGGSGDRTWAWGAGGLVGFLVLVAAVVHLFGRPYPQGVFDFVMGMNRWAFRVLAYVALMRDEYPPFRLDGGGSDPAAGGVAPPPGGPGALPDEERPERPVVPV